MRCPRPGFAAVTLLVGACIAGCSGHPTEPTEALTFTYDFESRSTGVHRRLRRLSPRRRGILRADFGPPRPPAAAGAALRPVHLRNQPERRSVHVLQGTSRRPVARRTSYRVSVSVEVATDTPAGCVGVGGAPGESVWIKAGATAVEPLPVRDGSYLRMNIDIGSQSAGGAQAVVLGDIANSRGCEQPRRWEIKSFQGRSTPVPISIPANGQTWLLFGADSGFEARTEIYFTRGAVTFTPM